MTTQIKLSPVYTFLLELAKRDGLPVSEVKKIIWLINSQEDLVGFPTVFNNLLNILIMMQVHANIRLADYGIADWPKVLRNILCKLPGWIIEFKKDHLSYPFKVRKDVKHPMSGLGLRKNPLYAICFNKYGDKDPKDDKYALKFALLQGHLILVHIMAMKEIVPLHSFESYDGEEILGDNHQLIYESTLALRQLCRQDVDSKKYLDHFDPAQNLDSFIRGLTIIRFNKTSTISHYFSSYVNCIRQMGRRFSSKRGYGGGGGGLLHGGNWGLYPGEIEMELDISDLDDPGNDWGELSTVPSHAVFENFTNEIKEYLAEDVPLPEIIPDDELALSQYECKKTKKGLWHHYLSVRGQMRHCIMANQLFTWSMTVLTTNEVATLLQTIDAKRDSLWNKIFWDKNDQLEAEVIAAISAMFWTGCPMEMALTAETIPLNHKKNSVFAIHEQENKAGENFWEWRIRTIKPKHYTNTNASNIEVRKTINYVYLPDLYDGIGILTSLARRRGDKNSQYGPIFTHKPKDLKKAIKAFTDTVCFGERITISKISYYFFNKIVEKTGDVAIAASITGKNHHLTHVRSFYFTPNVQKLRDIYYDVAAKVGRNIYNRDPRQISSISFQAYHVGAKKCPNIEDTKKAVYRIKQDLQQLGADWQSAPVAFHNLYTLYTVLMFGNFTGLRAVISPLISTTAIVNNGSFTVIADKDDCFGSKSRPVWIAKVLHEQLVAYEKHCLKISDLYQIEELDTPQPCFFLSEDKRAEQVRPKKVAKHLAQYLPVPANAHRRFWRTILIEKQCPAEVVDAWMGHWSKGETPWSVFGTMALFDYFSVLKSKLLPLLEEMGWQKIQSPLLKED